jgi:uncharacterized protein YjbI with pentapeptide repeats
MVTLIGSLTSAFAQAIFGGFIMAIIINGLINPNKIVNIIMVAGYLVGIILGIIISDLNIMEESNTETSTIITIIIIGSPLIINFLFISFFTSWKTYQEDPQFSYLRTLGLQLATFFSTRFNQANLTDTHFYQANLKHANFANATLIRTNFREAKNLKYAYVKNTILEQKTVRELLVHGKTNEIDFKQKDLHGAYLVDADLREIDFTDANFIDADLSGADLRGANLTRIQAIGTRFGNADLTGACLEAWNIDSTTDIKNIRADYVYLKNNQQERRPSSGTFSDGEFSKLFQEVLDTVDLIFKQGEFNIQVLGKTLDEIRNKLQIQVEAGEDIAVKSIEDKGDGIFVVRVTVPQGTDKAEVHEAFMQEYYENKALISEKDRQIQFLQNLTQQFIPALKSDINVQAQVQNTGQQNMFDKNEQNRSINIYGKAKNNNINNADGASQNMTVNEHHHHAASNEPPMEIVNRIQTLIDQAVKLDENVKNMAQMTLTGLKSAINESKSIEFYTNSLLGIAQEINNIGDTQTAGYIQAELENVKQAYQQ